MKNAKQEAEQTVQIFISYDHKINKLFKIKPPKNVSFHHYICLTLTTISEAFYSTYFLIPILSVIITHALVIRTEFTARVLARCVSWELDSLETDNLIELPEEEKNEIFKISCEETNETGFMYTRTMLLVRSFVLIFLIYFATLGITYKFILSL